MRRTFALTVLLACTMPALAAGAEIADEVTIRVRMFADPGTRTRELDITGTIANHAAGETVDVLAKDCGRAYRAYRVVAGTKTLPGGSWRLQNEIGGVDLRLLPINAYFRARWRGRLSEPVLNQVPAFVTATWRSRRRVVDVAVSAGLTGESFRGRFVELQRQVEGTDEWIRVRRARLGKGAYEGYLGRRFAARFTVPARGLTLRVLVPAQTGAPCFSAGVSAAWRS